MTRDLNKLHPYVKFLAEKLIKEAGKQGITIIVTSTLRTMAEQNALYAQGRTKPGSIVTNCKAGQSPHNWGVAFDIAVTKNGKVDWNDDAAYRKVGAIGQSLGLTWGGSFKKLYDSPHFEWFGGLTLKNLQAGKVPFNPLQKAVLQYGAKGASTMDLQKALKSKGFNCGAIDGIFGNKTSAALKEFQKAKKLPITGVVDAMTWAFLLV